MNNRNSIVLRADPWGTPYSHNFEMSDCMLFITTNCFFWININQITEK